MAVNATIDHKYDALPEPDIRALLAVKCDTISVMARNVAEPDAAHVADVVHDIASLASALARKDKQDN